VRNSKVYWKGPTCHMCEPHSNVHWSCVLVVHVSLSFSKRTRGYPFGYPPNYLSLIFTSFKKKKSTLKNILTFLTFYTTVTIFFFFFIFSYKLGLNMLQLYVVSNFYFLPSVLHFFITDDICTMEKK